MNDLRRRGGVPFGYKKENGKAVVNEEEVQKLRSFFRLFMAGASMAGAAHDAGLSCHHTTLPLLFKREAYIGTDFYPTIITKEYQQMLIEEWERRKLETTKAPYVRTIRFVKILTDFDPSSLTYDLPHTSPESYISALYDQIRPKNDTEHIHKKRKENHHVSPCH